jgi:hypothetical protein
MNQENEKGGNMPPMTGLQGGTQENPKPDQHAELKRLFIQGLYAILFLIILIAALQLYFSIQMFISTWFSYDYIPIVNSIYFLFIIVGGIYLIFSFIRSK